MEVPLLMGDCPLPHLITGRYHICADEDSVPFFFLVRRNGVGPVNRGLTNPGWLKRGLYPQIVIICIEEMASMNHPKG